MTKVRVFMSFDRENDEDLHDLLLEQGSRRTSGFEISAESEAAPMSASWDERVRRRICEADEVIVICGKHTAKAPGVCAELRIAQEEEKPYFLLWGRRETMCIKPATAKPGDSMYSWTGQILQDQITTTLRRARARDSAEPTNPG